MNLPKLTKPAKIAGLQLEPWVIRTPKPLLLTFQSSLEVSDEEFLRDSYMARLPYTHTVGFLLKMINLVF